MKAPLCTNLAPDTITPAPSHGKAWRRVVWCFHLIFLCGFLATMLALGYKIVRFSMGGHISADYGIRWSEVHALQQGFDPYDIWTCKITHPYLYPVDGYNYCWSRIDFDVNAEIFNEISQNILLSIENGTNVKPTDKNYFPGVGVYPPNAYTFFWPFSKLPLTVGERIWFSITFAVYFLSLYFVYRRIKPQNPLLTGKQLFFIILAGAGFAPLAWFALIANGNYGAIHLGALIILLVSLECSERFESQGKHLKSVLWQFVGGIAFAILLVKPQIGLLFGLPLLLSRKWMIIIVAGILSIAACFPPALMCGKSPLELLLHLQNSGIPWYQGSAFIPKIVQDQLWDLGLGRLGMKISMLAGIITCTFLSWRTRNDADWLVRLLPAIVLAPIWTFASKNDALIYVFVITFFVLRIVKKTPDWKFSTFFVFILAIFVNIIPPYLKTYYLTRFWLFITNPSIFLVNRQNLFNDLSDELDYLIWNLDSFFKPALLLCFVFWIYRYYKPCKKTFSV